MDLNDLQQLLGSLADVRLVCVGDIMVDRFVYGEVSRVSAEAPIPVMARTGETVMLGGAGNVARNVAALGGHVALVGVVGDDDLAREARALIDAEAGVEDFVVVDAARPTTLKTRFISAGQQLLRVDLEVTGPVEAEAESDLVAAIARAAPGARAILLSDYGKGVLTPAVIAACHAAAQAFGARLVVDSKARGFAHYGPVDVVKPNAAELARATNLPATTDAEVEAALSQALESCAARAILVTRAARGMSLAVRGECVRHFSRPAPEVFDTSGAGDTALAALGAALSAGAALPAAVELALIASSVAVEKAGTATAGPDEILEAELAAHRAPLEVKIVTVAGMAREAERWRRRGLKVGFTNGCFDMLHPGHIAYLAQARAWCDRLIVGVNSDASVRALKGPDRPVNSLEARALVLAGLSSVDLVTAFDEDTPRALIEAARPDLLVKGGDYDVDAVVGRDLVLGWGGDVKLAPFIEGHSTTETLRRLNRNR